MCTLLCAAGDGEQSSSTTARIGPGGVAEIQSQERDGRGQERIMMERRLGDRARRVEKTFNPQTGEEETQDNTYGIQDGMEEHFDREFQSAMQHGGRSQYGAASRGARPSLPQQQQQYQQYQQPQIGYSDYSRAQSQQQSHSPQRYR